MSSTWSKLKKMLRLNSSSASSSSAKLLSRAPNKSGSQSPSLSSCSLRSSSDSSKKTCAICLVNVGGGVVQAIFTAECSHSFHFHCIANSVKHGNYRCPICRCIWKDIPCQLPRPNADVDHNAIGQIQANYTPSLLLPTLLSHEPPCYSDDEALLVNTDPTIPASCASSNNLSIRASTEFPAIAASESVSDLAVLVSMRAPALLDHTRQVKRAPIDLVTVLDVSSSMGGPKLFLLKRAVCFVIENLGPDDRLSIVSFSQTARRILPLRRMTDRGREDARVAVNSLRASGGTDIVMGLRKGARVLEERREKNPVASIILLSDGKDIFNYPVLPSDCSLSDNHPTRVLEYLKLLPVSICPTSEELQNKDPHPTFPVHAFGFGADHDSTLMHAISDASCGTFSFIESINILQDAFARCIAGLLTVVARELKLTVTSISPGVDIGSIPSGKYASNISDQRLQGMIIVGDMYADEEKEFLVHLSVPISSTAKGEEETQKTSLLYIACSYWDTASESMVQLECDKVQIRRPEVLSPADTIVSLEVDRQRNRLLVIEGIAEAKEMAESGNFQGAQALLTNKMTTLLYSASGQCGDELCSWLEAELMDIRARMATSQMYETTGRPYVLSGLSSHSWQRATTRGDTANHSTVLRESGGSSSTVPVGYDTPSMISMVSKSQDLSAN